MQPQETGADIAAKLIPDELKALLDDIAQIAERAYRRGFQHGFSARLGAIKATPDQVANWRLARPDVPRYENAVGAPGTACAGEKWDLLSQLEKEALVESALGSLVAAHKSQTID